jgi:hypothetical protein
MVGPSNCAAKLLAYGCKLVGGNKDTSWAVVPMGKTILALREYPFPYPFLSLYF